MQEFSFFVIFFWYPPGSYMQTGRPPKHPRTPFGERLHAAREAADLSQADVAEKMGIVQHAYAAWERRSVALKPEQIEKLAEVLDVAPDYFFRSSKYQPIAKTKRVFDLISQLSPQQQEKIMAALEPFVLKHIDSKKTR